MVEGVEPVQPKPKKRNGCLVFFLGVVVLVGGVLAVGAIMGPDPIKDPVEMSVSITVSRPGSIDIEPTTCTPNGHSLLINAVGEGATTVELSRGELLADGSCRFTLTATVPTVTKYVLSLPGNGLDDRTVWRSEIQEGSELSVMIGW